MDTLHFERYEYKYIVPDDMTAAIRSFIRPYTLPDEHAAVATDRRYSIYNLYLDTPDLAIYRSSVNDDLDRFKLRIRWYDSSAAGPFFCEVKRKIQRVVIKDRARISLDDFHALVRGEPVSIFEHQGGKNFVDFIGRTERMGTLPRVFCRYTREAYESLFGDYARLTIDREMSFQRVTAGELCPDPKAWNSIDSWQDMDRVRNGMLIELKFTRDFPRWMADLVAEFDLERTGYSKYVISVDHELAQQHSLSELVHRLPADF